MQPNVFSSGNGKPSQASLARETGELGLLLLKPDQPFCHMTYVIRLSLGKLLVDLLHVVKRANTPRNPQQMSSSTDHGFLGRGFDPHHPQH